MKILNRVLAEIAYNNENTGLNAQTLQEAIDALYQLVLSLGAVDIDRVIDGGDPSTLENQLLGNIDGGTPSAN